MGRRTSGPAKLARVVIKEIDEWGTRFAALQAGDADYVTVNPEFWPQVDEIASKDCRCRDRRMQALYRDCHD